MGKKILLAFSVFLLLSACSKEENISINKIEHFYLSTHDAEYIYQILSQQLELPIVWEFQNWGSFASGGISLGNVVIEIIESDSTHRKPYGIALESSHSIEESLPLFDSVNLSTGNISKTDKWNLMSLNGLLPEGIDLFLCDYHNRELITLNRKKAIEELWEKEGGKLGVQSVQSLVIGTKDLPNHESELSKISGISKKDDEYLFLKGPKLKVIASDSLSFALLVKVRSIEKAKLALGLLNIKANESEKGLEIDETALPIHMTLVD
ncbi:MAG: hypothetical protein MRZ79_13605 [Bacteroidia bacterium]|nr:hypothetical protein [Bacteroidia bacterium]